MTTLISFLGKSRNSQYQSADYRFEDGSVVSTRFFGAALMERMRPDRTLLLGTAGSMWDALDLNADSPDWVTLVSACEHASVDQALLDRLRGQARGAMASAELLLIPYAENEAGQFELLRTLAQHVGEGESVVIDVTHGFRHLPMLALVAARYLAQLRNARVTDIYYGALEMTGNGITPVVKLEGLLRMLNWVEAFAAHDASGSYAPFATLAQHDGMTPQAATALEQAAFFERLGNVSDAKAKLSVPLTELGHLGGATGLFAEQLGRRLGWARQSTAAARKLALFHVYRERDDFLRAAIHLQEAMIDAVCDSKRLRNSEHADREEARASLNRENEVFSELADLRNTLAHGTLGDRTSSRAQRTQKTTSSAAALRTRLEWMGQELSRDFMPERS